MAKRKLTKKPSELKGKKAAAEKAASEKDKEEDKAEDEEEDAASAEDEKEKDATKAEAGDDEEEEETAAEDEKDKDESKAQDGEDDEEDDEEKAQAKARGRIRSIMKSDAAKGLSNLAEHLAYDTGLSSKSAIAVLKAAAKDKAAGDKPNPLAAAMARVENPKVKTGAVDNSDAARMLSKVAQKFKKP